MNNVATTTVHVQLGTAFWVLLGVIVVGAFLYWQLGTEKMNRVINSGLEEVLER